MPPVDLKQTLKQLYNPSAKEVSVVEVPEMPFLMIDGAGNPNTAPAYAEAVNALYSVSYTLKFMLQKGPLALDYTVMPLEGLWWWPGDPANIDMHDKDRWQWTAMIAQPEVITGELLREAITQAGRKKDLPALPRLRLERFHEGRATQILHIGPYAAEAPTIERLHRFITEHGYALRGKHHEIYLSDPRRAAPEKLKTVTLCWG